MINAVMSARLHHEFSKENSKLDQICQTTQIPSTAQHLIPLSSQLAKTYYYSFYKWLVCLTPEVAVFQWHMEVILKLII